MASYPILGLALFVADMERKRKEEKRLLELDAAKQEKELFERFFSDVAT